MYLTGTYCLGVTLEGDVTSTDILSEASGDTHCGIDRGELLYRGGTIGASPAKLSVDIGGIDLITRTCDQIIINVMATCVHAGMHMIQL